MKFFKSFVSILLVIFLISFTGVAQVYAKDLTIKDIQPENESYTIVQWVVDQGYMSMTLGRFFPDKYVKRCELAAILTKLTGSGTVLQNPKKPTFQDVTTKNQFYRQIETVKAYMTSYKAKTAKLFKPDNYMTREDALYSIVKLFGYDSDEAISSNDNTDLSLDDLIDDAKGVSTTLVKYIAVGISNELMDLRTVGDKMFFDPKKNITRKDLAILIYNANQKKDYNTEETTDENVTKDETTPEQTTETQTTTQTTTSGPIDVSTILSDSNAVSKMLNIKEGETINLSDINPSMRGTVKKTSSNPNFQSPYDQTDTIMLGTIVTDKNLEYDKENMVSFEYVYNVTSCEKAAILIGFNENDLTNDTNKAIWAVNKGKGILVFKIPVTPKKWVGAPFRVSAGMIDLVSYRSLPVGYRVSLLPSDPGRISIY